MLRSLNLSVTLPSSKSVGGPTRTLLGGSDRTFGYRNRVEPRTHPAIVAVKAAQAMANGEVKKRTMKFRRSSPFLGGAAAGLAGMAGLGGAAAGTGGAADGAAGCGAGVAGSGIASEPSESGDVPGVGVSRQRSGD